MESSEESLQQLRKIISTQSFEKLLDWRCENLWKKLSPTERLSFPMQIVSYGHTLLPKEEKKASSLFSLAKRSAVEEQRTAVLLRIAQAWLDVGVQQERKEWLQKACSTYEEVTKESPKNREAWIAKGKAERLRALHTQEQEHFAQALESFQRGIELSTEPLQQAEGYWQKALCLYHQGMTVGEAVDIRDALDAFAQAAECGCDQASFHYDYGQAMMAMAEQVGDHERLARAAQSFRRSVELEKEHFDSWYALSQAQTQIVLSTGQEGDLALAQEYYQKAVELDPEHATLWLNWGRLLYTLGKKQRDTKRLKASLHYFDRAHTLDPQDPTILCAWGDALVAVGIATEELVWFQEAEDKLSYAIEMHSESPQLWCALGNLLVATGQYFGEADAVTEGIERYHYALGIDEKHADSWYGLALGNLILGEALMNLRLLEEATDAFQQCAICGRSDASFYNDWGVAYMKIAEVTNAVEPVEHAVQKFEHALQLQKQFDDVDVECLYNYGCALDFLGDFYENEEYYQRSVKILSQVLLFDPQFSHARYNLAMALSHLGEASGDFETFDKAHAHFSALITEDPEDDIAWNDWGLSLTTMALMKDPEVHQEERHNYFNEAEEKLRRAASLGNLTAYYSLASLYALREEPRPAIHYLERAAEHGALPSADDILHDEWMHSIKDDPEFQEFIRQLKTLSEES